MHCGPAPWGRQETEPSLFLVRGLSLPSQEQVKQHGNTTLRFDSLFCPGSVGEEQNVQKFSFAFFRLLNFPPFSLFCLLSMQVRFLPALGGECSPSGLPARPALPPFSTPGCPWHVILRNSASRNTTWMCGSQHSLELGTEPSAPTALRPIFQCDKVLVAAVWRTEIGGAWGVRSLPWGCWWCLLGAAVVLGGADSNRVRGQTVPILSGGKIGNAGQGLN